MDAETYNAWLKTSFGQIHIKAEAEKERKRQEAQERKQRQGAKWYRCYAPGRDDEDIVDTLSRPTEDAALTAIYRQVPYVEPSISQDKVQFYYDILNFDENQNSKIYDPDWHDVDLAKLRSCKKCGELKPTIQFYTTNNRLRGECRECTKKEQMKRDSGKVKA